MVPVVSPVAPASAATLEPFPHSSGGCGVVYAWFADLGALIQILWRTRQ
jgi:hypothetical protein